MYHQLIETGVAQKLPIPQDAWLMFSSENHELIRLDLKPGEMIERHENSWRIIFFVLEGCGNLTIEDESHHLNTHQLMAVQPGVQREWKNTGDQVLKLLVVKSIETG